MDTETLKKVPIDKLVPYARNAKTHSPEQILKLRSSLREFGFVAPAVVDKDYNILVGHGRVQAAREEGYKEVPCVFAENLTEAQKRAYILADNKLAEYGSDWDKDMLSIELSELQDEDFDIGLLGFTDDEIAKYLDSDSDAQEDDFDVDAASEAEPFIEEGDLVILGRHRMLCGDSTKSGDVAVLMDGQKANLVITDPPYGIAIGTGAAYQKTKKDRTIMNDNLPDEEFLEFLVKVFSNMRDSLVSGGVFYIWYASNKSLIFLEALKEAGLDMRQNLIWEKNTFTLGRQDYQWSHEPCQPAGTMVWTPDGKKPIEELKDGDRVISFDTYSGCVKGYKDGWSIRTASRQYDGILYGIGADGKQTWATDNHEFSVRFNPDTAETWSTYLMVNEKGWWRVGITRTYDARGFGLKRRFEQKNATAAWIVSTFRSQADAQMGEQLLACKYGIPYTIWNAHRGQSPDYNQRTEEQIDWLYNRMELKEMQERAEKLLSDFGRSIKYPLVTNDSKAEKFSRRVTAKINACNIIPGLMMVPIPKEHYEGTDTFEWAVIDKVDHKEHHGQVYSLAVDKYHHYIADGIVTHNCLYGWTDGAAHKWYSDRKQSTVLKFDKPRESKLHSTMKPVALIGYQMKNSSQENAIVLDLFGGSGTTLIAAEQLNRICYTAELDPKYASAIVRRYAALTGGVDDIKIIRGGEEIPCKDIYIPTEEDLAFKEQKV